MEDKYRYQTDIVFEYEDNGKTKSETESWLINAVSVTDAETKANVIIEKMAKESHAVMECRIKSVKETKITKVIE